MRRGPPPRPEEDRVLREGTCGEEGRTGYRYLVYVPARRGRAADRLPLVLFLHGSEERGHDLSKVATHGLPRLVAEGADLPFVLLAPQLPSGRRWSVRALVALLDDAAATWPIDPDRVSVTGLSLGGEAAWALALFRPGRFAALATVCGGGDPSRAALLRHLPCRVYHGANDDVVPLAESAAMVEALRAAGGDVTFIVYPDANHAEAWERAYADPELMPFLLAARRRP